MTAALVLAGTRPGGDPFAQSVGVAHKALIELDGEPLLSRVVDALKTAGCAPVLVSCDEGPVAELARSLGAEVLAPKRGPSASTMAAFECSGAPLVVTTADHGLLRPEWVRELIEGTPAAADVSVMLAERQVIEQAMPGSRRTYLRFGDGQWSGCNLFLLNTADAKRAIAIWMAVEADRKRPWRIAARLGFGFLLSYLLGRLTLRDGLAQLGRREGLSAALVPASDGLAAVDVDKFEDLVAVRQLIESGAAS